MKITDRVRAFAEPVVEAHGCSLWDVEYVREGGEWFLRLYIDKDGDVPITSLRASAHTGAAIRFSKSRDYCMLLKSCSHLI